LGIAGWYRNSTEKTRHKSNIWGVYVIPERRGTGIGRALIQLIIKKVRKQKEIEQIQLSVQAGSAADFLYQSLGFQTFGVEQMALKVGSKYINLKHMVYFL
jgi:ribosomal protein S18 acetylase RimI-like enzyme